MILEDTLCRIWSQVLMGELRAGLCKQKKITSILWTFCELVDRLCAEWCHTPTCHTVYGSGLREWERRREIGKEWKTRERERDVNKKWFGQKNKPNIIEYDFQIVLNQYLINLTRNIKNITYLIHQAQSVFFCFFFLGFPLFSLHKTFGYCFCQWTEEKVCKKIIIKIPRLKSTIFAKLILCMCCLYARTHSSINTIAEKVSTITLGKYF